MKTENAHDRKVRTAAQELAKRITQMPTPVTDEQVLEVLQTQNCNGEVLGDAFWVMDNSPSRFADYQVWHPRLRSLRNNPAVGERMFALFQ